MIHRFLHSFPVALTLVVSAIAADIRPGATMQVKPNSIWFQDKAQLTRWQQLRISGDAKELKAYEDEKLGNRNAWQFIYEMTVRIKSYDAKSNQADVEMKTPGRLIGTSWVIDASAIEGTKK